VAVAHGAHVHDRALLLRDAVAGKLEAIDALEDPVAARAAVRSRVVDRRVPDVEVLLGRPARGAWAWRRRSDAGSACCRTRPSALCPCRTSPEYGTRHICGGRG
jgi:hypothetical protein